MKYSFSAHDGIIRFPPTIEIVGYIPTIALRSPLRLKPLFSLPTIEILVFPPTIEIVGCIPSLALRKPPEIETDSGTFLVTWAENIKKARSFRSGL